MRYSPSSFSSEAWVAAVPLFAIDSCHLTGGVPCAAFPTADADSTNSLRLYVAAPASGRVYPAALECGSITPAFGIGASLTALRLKPSCHSQFRQGIETLLVHVLQRSHENRQNPFRYPSARPASEAQDLAVREHCTMTSIFPPGRRRGPGR